MGRSPRLHSPEGEGSRHHCAGEGEGRWPHTKRKLTEVLAGSAALTIFLRFCVSRVFHLSSTEELKVYFLNVFN